MRSSPARKLFIAASAATRRARSTPVAPTPPPRRNMPRRVSQVRASTHSVLSADQEKETASTGRHRPVKAKVRSVNSAPLLRSKDIPSKASGGLPIRAITIRFSPGKGRTPRAAKSIYGERRHGRRIRARGLSRAIPQIRPDDVPRQSSGDHLREGPRLAHPRYRHGNDEL